MEEGEGEVGRERRKGIEGWEEKERERREVEERGGGICGSLRTLLTSL